MAILVAETARRGRGSGPNWNAGDVRSTLGNPTNNLLFSPPFRSQPSSHPSLELTSFMGFDFGTTYSCVG